MKSTQAVTFTGVSGFHPIAAQDCGPANVFPAQVDGSSAVVRTFSVQGTYGIHCVNHGGATGSGMAMQILVVP